MAIPLYWPVFSIPKLAILIKFARINGHSALTAKIWLQNGWPFKRGALYNNEFERNTLSDH